MPLTLTLRVGEYLNIGDAALLVHAMGGGEVKLKLEFPRDVVITRSGIPAVTPNEAAQKCIDAHRMTDKRTRGGR